MKKFFTGVALVAMLFTVGATTTSCDEETIGQIIPLLQQLLGGKETVFTGTMSVEGLKSIEEGWAYIDEKNPSQRVANASCSFKVNKSLASQEQTATITIPQITCGNVVVTNLVIDNVSYADGAFGSEEYCFPITCTLSVNGESLPVESTEENIASFNAVVKAGAVDDKGNLKFELRSLYIGQYAFNITYSGVTSQK